jgi:anti-anti-sigma factor
LGPGVSTGELSGRPVQPPRKWSNHAFGLTAQEEGSTLYLRLSGDFDWQCIGRVEAALGRISASVIRRVVFDLRGLSFLDLAALKTILRTNERACVERFEVIVVRPRGFLNRIFTLTRAGERLTMVDRFPLSAGH